MTNKLKYKKNSKEEQKTMVIKDKTNKTIDRDL